MAVLHPETASTTQQRRGEHRCTIKDCKIAGATTWQGQGNHTFATTLENLHAGIMDVKNCVNDILQKLKVFQERVKTVEMENSNLKRENKKLKCFLDQDYHKTDELDQCIRKEKFVFMEFLRTSQVKSLMEEKSFWK